MTEEKNEFLKKIYFTILEKLLERPDTRSVADCMDVADEAVTYAANHFDRTWGREKINESENENVRNP